MKTDYKNNAKNKPGVSGNIKLKVLLLAGFSMISLFFTQLVFANNLATDGQQLARVQSEIKRLERENMTLEAKIAEQASLTNLSKKAVDMGFKTPEKITVL